MKKLLLLICLLTSTAFAYELHKDAYVCEDGKLFYMHPAVQHMDICRAGLKAQSPEECQVLARKLVESGKMEQFLKDFIAKRDKELCGQ